MPRRIFKYDKAQGGVVEVTPEETRALCDEISADVAERRGTLEFGLGTGKRRNASIWPMTSVSMGVAIEDIPEAHAKLREQGVFTEYDRQGYPILRDRAHKKAHQAALGWFDGDAGYSDREPQNFRASDVQRRR